jgi:hypothetical protein
MRRADATDRERSWQLGTWRGDHACMQQWSSRAAAGAGAAWRVARRPSDARIRVSCAFKTDKRVVNPDTCKICNPYKRAFIKKRTTQKRKHRNGRKRKRPEGRSHGLPGQNPKGIATVGPTLRGISQVAMGARCARYRSSPQRAGRSAARPPF